MVVLAVVAAQFRAMVVWVAAAGVARRVVVLVQVLMVRTRSRLVLLVKRVAMAAMVERAVRAVMVVLLA